MKRTTIYLSDEQVRRLDLLAKATGLKVAELIRRFIDAGLDRDEKKAEKRGR
jgi:predicted DNA-binding protein